MRVLHCITSLDIGGAQIMLLRYLRATARQGGNEHAVVSLAPVGALGEALGDCGVRVLSLGQSRGRPSLAALVALTRMLRAERPDIVHGWMYHANLASMLASALGPRVPVIWGVHHSLRDIAAEPPLTRIVIRAGARLSRRAAAITYCSRASAAQHERISYDPSKRAVLPNGIDTDEFRPRPGAAERLRAMLGVPEGRLLIGSVARDHPMKAPEVLVRAVADILSRGHDVQAVFVGEGQTSGRAARAARELGVADRVSLLDARSDVPDVVAGFDIFALSSAWGEAFSLAVGEAMASGVPAVVTDLGDCAWLVGDAGGVAQPGDAASLADALESMIELGPEGRAALGARARSRIEERFSLERYRDRLDGLLAQVAA